MFLLNQGRLASLGKIHILILIEESVWLDLVHLWRLIHSTWSTKNIGKVTRSLKMTEGICHSDGVNCQALWPNSPIETI